MSIETSRSEFQSTFGPSDSLTDGVVQKLDALKQIFNVSAEDLYVHWETFNINEAEQDLDLNAVNLDTFQLYLQKHLASAAKQTPSAKKARDMNSSALKRKPLKPINSSSPAAIPETPSMKIRKLENTPYKTPHLKLDSSPTHFATANSTFQSPQSEGTPTFTRQPQKESNTVLETLNDDVKDFSNELEDPKLRIASNFDPSKYKFRTMAMKLLESADVFDDQIDTLTQLIQNHNQSNIQFGNPCLSSQFELMCCGRIVPDSPIYDKLVSATLNATSLYLETSRLGGIGQRVPLDLSELKEYSFFPGQVVCFKGRNPTGTMFVVQEIVPIPPLGAPVTSREELKEFRELQGETGLKFVIASGPFSNSTTLNYEKFGQFVDRVNNAIKPNVVVLFGPFLDITNGSVQNGEIELPNEPNQPKNLDEVFKKVVTPVLKTFDTRIQIILIPSLKDVVAQHCSYPQDAFDRRKLGLPKNIKVFPNPSGFAINEILFGCSNLDLFKDLKDVVKLNDERNGVVSNRFERIVNHIFEQRNYYPMFPGSIARRNVPKEQLDQLIAQDNGLMAEEYVETNVGGAALEVPYMGLAELGDSLPDILVIPSELKFFAKVIRNVIVINPGSFIRPAKDVAKEDGTYVVISTQKPDTEGSDNVEPVDESGDMYYHNVFKRSRVEIYKS